MSLIQTAYLSCRVKQRQTLVRISDGVARIIGVPDIAAGAETPIVKVMGIASLARPAWRPDTIR